jgi:hypothetical protein
VNLKRIINRPLAKLAGWHAGRQLRSWLAMHARTGDVQDRLLQRLMAAHADSAFGREHDFAKIHTLEDFRKAVPLRHYHDFDPWIDRVLAGETSALLPPGQQVLMFSMTSGTTGKPKHIPVTPRFLSAMRRGWNIWGLGVLAQYLEAWVRPILQITSDTCEQRSPTGLPCGAISGLLAQTQKRIVRRFYCTPTWAPKIADPESRYYAILRYGVEQDVAFLTTANPSSTIKLIEAGQTHARRLVEDIRCGTLSLPAGQLPEGVSPKGLRPNPLLAQHLEFAMGRDGEFRPEHVWQPAFLANWMGGTLKLYMRRLKELFGDLPVHDIGLLASEGRFSIPLEPNSPVGIAEITENILEFIPAEEYGKDQPRTLGPREVEVGGEYFLVFSNWTGLMRYNLDDRVRVTDFYGETPAFEFLCRGVSTASITGEKITESQIVEAMRRARQKHGELSKLDRFEVQGRFPQGNGGDPYYELRLEKPDGLDVTALAATMDRALGELNMEYASKRHTGRLGPIRPVVLPDGTFNQAERENIARRRGRSEQYKHCYLCTDVMEG